MSGTFRRAGAVLGLGVVLSCGDAGPPDGPTQGSAEASTEQGAAAPGEAGAIPGRYRPARSRSPEAALTEEQRRAAERLRAIGYLDGVEPARDSGVTLHDPERAFPGLNFYTSGHTEGALLIDMEGRVVHEWSYPSRDAFDGSAHPTARERQWWRRAYLFPNGDVLAIVTGSGVLKVDRESNLLWALDVYSHHDLAIAPNGDLYLLGREVGMVPRVNPEEPIVEDVVVVLDANGKEKRRFSLLEAFERSDWVDLWTDTERSRGDIFHTNSIEWLDGRAGARNPAFAEGNLLISMRGLNAIAVVDPVAEEVVWGHRGSYRRQHDPKILPNGNLLLFDNHGDGPSAILEFDPADMELVWEFRGSESQPFYSRSCGTSERLPNGNTLISETDFGRAFEVTRGGDIVWEFYNPHRAGDRGQFIATIPELVRLAPDFPTDWLDEP